MTALSLFDAVRRHENASGEGDPSRALAAGMVEHAIGEFDRIRQYADDFSPTDWSDPEPALEVERSIYRLYEDWVAEATQIFDRISKLSPSITRVGELRDAIGSMMARLKMTPEMTARAHRDILQGRALPLEELRHELHARLRS